MDDLLAESSTGKGDTPALAAITGTAGVGKSTLAVWWAHQVSTKFPDGQLYINLRGFAAGTALAVEDALRQFLEAFEVPPDHLPVSVEAQAALFRTLMAERKVLVLLDNARDAEQVRPLLPGSTGCFTLVTSRNDVAGLVAREGARPVTLNLLTAGEAQQLLIQRLGAERVAAEPDAAQSIIAGCARLPLALAVVAARAATQPQSSLSLLARQLRHVDAQLNMLTAGDAVSDVRAALSWSYQALGADAARLFRLMGTHPGPDIATAAVASLAGVPIAHAMSLLSQLAQANLLTEEASGRYYLHDLLRAYAVDLTQELDSTDDCRRAHHRILDHYLHTAHMAARLLEPHRENIILAQPQPGVIPEDLYDYEHAMAWFSAERSVMLASIELAASNGFDLHTAQLAWTLTTFFYLRGYWQDWAAVQHTTLRTAQRSRDQTGQARAHRHVASAYIRLARYDDAIGHLRRALALLAELDDSDNAAGIHYSIAWALDLSEQHHEALQHARRAMAMYQAAGQRIGHADSLNLIGWCHAKLGHYRQAVTYCRKALLVHQQLGDRHGEAGTWDSLGYAHSRLGQHAKATADYERAITLYRNLGDLYNEADTLAHAGDNHLAAGDHEAAVEDWRRAVTILDELGHPDAYKVRAKMADH
ncbi:tetratricopeptide repeat protein [Rhizocola hellebori]|uniref:tetratricopeptide repeat protein n=1 Tax=Rhizocola hellebori TaxID=1392758 RepID=UPI0019430042|nr:tetratricopeptide repeat protein [Rhizocola hellebori]